MNLSKELYLPTKIELLTLKRFLPFLLLILFLFNSMGYYFLYQFNKYDVVTRHVTSKTTLQVIIIADIERMTTICRLNSKEFVLNGHLFDIIKEERNNHFTILTCFLDSREEMILTIMNRISNSHQDLTLAGFAFNLTLPQNTLTTNASEAMIQEIPVPAKVKLHSWISLPSSPPPEFS